ncbi:MAG: hypothetical protein JWN56_1524 [Sphingobacteriales bacterium]|nr:hypothetical protein [Sphingobacteriales bacterium]
MNAKHLPLLEKKEQISAQIFATGTEVSKKNFLIEEIGDYIPGSVMIQNLNTMTNTYMNKEGCDILKHSKEELELLGPKYFEKFFPEEEILFLSKELFKFTIEQDYNKVYSFFQRVRPDDQSDYKWYFTTSRLCKQANNGALPNIMHIAIEVNSLNLASHQISAICNDSSYILKHYREFNLLSKREKEIICLISQGVSSYEISERLFISIHTVNNHRKNIMHKLDIVSISQLIRFAVSFGLVE